MILQLLNQYYDRLVEAGKLERSGWQIVKVSYALQIDDEGQLKRVIPLGDEQSEKRSPIELTLDVSKFDKFMLFKEEQF